MYSKASKKGKGLVLERGISLVSERGISLVLERVFLLFWLLVFGGSRSRFGGSWFLVVFGSWFLFPGSWFLVPGSCWCSLLGYWWFLVLGGSWLPRSGSLVLDFSDWGPPKFIQSLYLRMSTFESRNKSIHPSLYLRMSTWFAFTIKAILVSKVLYTTTSASFEIRNTLQSSRFFLFCPNAVGGRRCPLPPNPPPAFFQHIHLSSFILSLYVSICPKFL